MESGFAEAVDDASCSGGSKRQTVTYPSASDSNLLRMCPEIVRSRHLRRLSNTFLRAFQVDTSPHDARAAEIKTAKSAAALAHGRRGAGGCDEVLAPHARRPRSRRRGSRVLSASASEDLILGSDD